jgi:hypothetical protein
MILSIVFDARPPPRIFGTISLQKRRDSCQRNSKPMARPKKSHTNTAFFLERHHAARRHPESNEKDGL